MKSFKSRLLASILLIVFIVFLFIGVFIGEWYKNSSIEAFDNRIKRESLLIASDIQNNGGIDSITNDFVKRYSDMMDVQIAVLNEEKEVLIHVGQEDTTEMELEWKEVIAQLKGELPRNTVEVSGDTKYHFYQMELYNETEKQGYLLVGTELSTIEEVYKKIHMYIFLSLLVAFLVIYLLIKQLIYRYIRPIESVTKVAEELAKGNYQARTYEERINDTGLLSSSINIVAKNLQEMVRAQEIQEDRLGTLIENIGSGLILIDSRGYINLVNKAYKDLFSIRSADYLYKLYYKVIPYREIIDLAEEIFMTEHKIVREMTLEMKKEKRDFQVYGVPIIGANDKWMGILIVFHDFTELKKLEQIRKDFVANVSHELKTPITSIKGFSETLLDGAMEDRKTLEEFLRIILKESDRLQSLIKDLLDLSKLEQHHFSLNKEGINITEVLDKVIKLLIGRATEKNIEIHFAQENAIILIEGDRERLTQVFLNLLSNAISYTPNGGKVNVYIIEKKKNIEISIADTGIGIAQSEIQRIFERFYRVDKARSRNSGGTGLGLAIVKHLVDLHKGTIRVESEFGKGTTFTITLNKEFPL